MGGFPAARLSDLTAHGGTVVIGCPTVLINNLPASRIGDNHVCPMVTGVVPHVGGPFVLGSFTVLVGFVPQSRVTDMLVCVGPPDILANGSPNVLVGMVGAMGVFGLMVGGLMAGLSNFLGGFPKAALQNGNIVTQYSPNIVIEGTPEFQAKAIRDLNTIANTPSGKKLLKSLADSGKTTRIHIDTPDGSSPGNWAWTDPPPSGSGPHPGYLKSDGSAGSPANTEVGYDPDRVKLGGPPGSPYNSANWAQSPNRPADVGLYHELVHCDDMQQGKLDSSNGTKLGTKAGTSLANYEVRAAGLPPYDKSDYSENSYRSDRGLPARTFY
jgi:type VI secretion system secreted protein VgrG